MLLLLEQLMKEEGNKSDCLNMVILEYLELLLLMICLKRYDQKLKNKLKVLISLIVFYHRLKKTFCFFFLC